MNLFWSALAALVLPLAGAVSLAGLLGLAGVLLRARRRHRRAREALAQRLETEVQRPAQAQCFECRRCHHIFWYRSIRGGVCLNCWCELAAFLKQVAS